MELVTSGRGDRRQGRRVAEHRPGPRAQRHAAGRAIPDPILAGLGPLIFEHLNFSGRYPFNRPVLDRPLRDPNPTDEDDA